MPKYLIEGSCDGGLFSETISANSQADAEAFAIERLCEAWGEEYGPDTTLDDLGDAASVTEYTADDYARDAAPRMLAALQLIYTDDDGDGYVSAEGMAEIRAAIAEATGTPTAQPADPIPAAQGNNLAEGARAIIYQRDHMAEHGAYDRTTFAPDDDQAFDDWAADILETALGCPTAQPGD